MTTQCVTISTVGASAAGRLHRPCRGRSGAHGRGFDGSLRGKAIGWLQLGMAWACISFGCTLRAELQWQERRVQLEPLAGATEATGMFECVNRGTTPVRVIEVRSGCGCTVSALDRNVILPGETGKLHAVFQIGERKGRQSVGISVTTAEPAIVRHELTLEVAITDFITIAPRLVFWRLGEENTAKLFQIELVAGYRFVGAESTTPAFAVNVAGREGGAVQLRVVPRDTWATRNGAIKVKVARDQEPPVEIHAWVQVL